MEPAHEGLAVFDRSTNNIMKTKYIKNIALAASFAAFTPLVTAQDMKEAEPAEESSEEVAKAMIEPGSLTAAINDSVTFSTLAAALKAAELDTVLGTKGSYTIFAPTDEAFQKLPEGTLDKLLLPENKEKLRSLLLYHVVPGNVMSTDLKDMDVKTMNGEKIEVDVDDNGKDIEINDSKVFSADVVAGNGVMHSIGEVLVPESLDGFAGLDD